MASAFAKATADKSDGTAIPEKIFQWLEAAIKDFPRVGSLGAPPADAAPRDRLKLLASVRRTVSMGVERVGWTDKVKRGTDDERA